jgi:ferritin-like metal-binding protein YciE
MPAKTHKETFLVLLSHVREGTEKATKIYDELGQVVQDPQVKDALEARAFVSQNILAKIDQCFKIIGEQPVKLSGRLQDTFLEDFRKEVNEMQSPTARRFFVLAKFVQLAHLRIGELAVLVAAADATGHYGVGVLLESCLADSHAFVERTRRLIQGIIEVRVAERKGVEQAA